MARHPHSAQLPLDLAPRPRRARKRQESRQLGLLADLDPVWKGVESGRLMTPEKLKRRFWRP